MKKQILNKLREELKRAEEKEKTAGSFPITIADFHGISSNVKHYEKAQGFTNGLLEAIEIVQSIKEGE